MVVKTRYRPKEGKRTYSRTSQTKSKVRDDPPRKKYAGVKFPKLDLFPHMPKVNVSPKNVLKTNRTDNERELTMKAKNKQMENGSSRPNLAEGIQTAPKKNLPIS